MDVYGRIELDLGTKFVYLIPNYFEIYVNNQAIVLSHYPIRCFNSYSKGAWCVHSHVHGHIDDCLPSGRKNKILDVGLESIKEVQLFEEIKVIMDQKPIVIEDHHTNKTKNPF
jgi:calcineurin-like phosphoesterase family protein